MNITLKGKQVAGVELKNCEKLQTLGCFNKNRSDCEQLVGAKIESVISRGVALLVKFSGGKNLLLAPEYGGRIIYHPENAAVPDTFHFKMVLADNSAFTVALSGFGGVQMLSDDLLNVSYIYKRDFSDVPSPSGDEFRFDSFRQGLANKNVNMKAAIVGTEALVVGLSNSSFQDILFQQASTQNEKLPTYLKRKRFDFSIL